nr:gamma-glutamyl-gamma-aminobutyrate hydrolase family protein [Kordiimonas gwangyangensis]
MKPVVAIMCDTTTYGPHRYHQAGDKYVQALVRCADVTPVLIPALDEPIATDAILGLADGILFTGGYSNIQRHHYGDAPAPAGEHEDRTGTRTPCPLCVRYLILECPCSASAGVCRS